MHASCYVFRLHKIQIEKNFFIGVGCHKNKRKKSENILGIDYEIEFFYY